MTTKHVLIIARWPLGGIRTYMRYVFGHFPSHFSLTLLASSTHEDAALIKDAKEYGARLLLVQGADKKGLVLATFKELRTNRYDIILSQGFISAVAAFPANLFFRIPHILTIHGIVEPRYLNGRFGGLKRFFLGKILAGFTVLYAVSNDMLNHLYEQFPELTNDGPRSIVIPNGIELSELEQSPVAPINLRAELAVDDTTFLFGFFGRFMPQKGFDLLIDAVHAIKKVRGEQVFAVVAVGSGDYQREYQRKIHELELDQYFYFLPFMPQVHHLYPQVDAIVMPSRWEASGLLAMESLCMGTPLIASNCIGLQETVRETPALVFPSENVTALAQALNEVMATLSTNQFRGFVPDAHRRYDVCSTANKLQELLEESCYIKPLP